MKTRSSFGISPTGKELRRATTDHDQTFAIAYSPDGKMIATTGADCRVAFWDATTLRLTGRFGLSQNTGFLVFSPDGKTICVGGAGSVMRIWKLDGRRFQGSPVPADVVDPDESQTFAAAFSGDGNRVVWSGQDGVVRVWDVKKNAGVAQFRGHVGEVMQVAFSTNSRFVASAGQDGTILVWDVSHIGEK